MGALQPAVRKSAGPAQTHRSSRSSAGRLVFSLLVLVLASGIFVFRQELLDQYNVWSFQPDAEVSELAEDAGMNSKGRFYYLASRPQLQARETFNRSCSTVKGHGSEMTAVLGCYAAQRIYLFDITEQQLDGIKEVTAAHEMLHAVYERLDRGEKRRVDSMVAAEADRITDPVFTQLLKEYEKSEPGERNNELHSLIGTQIATISPELEAYYKRYFIDRMKTVSLYTKYESVFRELKTRQEELATELESLGKQIEQEAARYNQETAALNDDVASFNRKARNGGGEAFSSEAAFNAERNRLVRRQNDLSATRDGLNVTISTYNTKRGQLALINSEAEALNRSINSNLEPLPSI